MSSNPEKIRKNVFKFNGLYEIPLPTSEIRTTTEMPTTTYIPITTEIPTTTYMPTTSYIPTTEMPTTTYIPTTEMPQLLIYLQLKCLQLKCLQLLICLQLLKCLQLPNANYDYTGTENDDEGFNDLISMLMGLIESFENYNNQIIFMNNMVNLILHHIKDLKKFLKIRIKQNQIMIIYKRLINQLY